jgi:hypothetical protein
MHRTHATMTSRDVLLRRRTFLKGAAMTALGTALPMSFSRRANALGGASRVIFFYFPDGVPAESQNGDGSAWHAWSSNGTITLPEVLSPLESFKQSCTFFRGLSLGATDTGSHPGGAKKLLTGKDGGNGWSLNHYLGQTIGAQHPHRHVNLGVMSTQKGTDADKFITYVGPGSVALPNDNPVNVFQTLFGGAPSDAPLPGGGSVTPDVQTARKQSVLDGAIAEIDALKFKLGSVEASKLEFHLEALREVEQRLETVVPPPVNPIDVANCSDPEISASGVDTNQLQTDMYFPAILRMQIDNLVTAMACNLTKVGTIQCSYHTSDLNMSQFPSTEMSSFAECVNGTPQFGLQNCHQKRSHEASHYGASHAGDLYRHFVAQRKWYVSQLAYLLGELAARPEGSGTMLDHTLVLVCSEVSDGNTHSHDNMPFLLCGHGGGAVSTGKVLDVGYTRHGALLTSVARAMGADIWSYGDTADGPLGGI